MYNRYLNIIFIIVTCSMLHIVKSNNEIIHTLKYLYIGTYKNLSTSLSIVGYFDDIPFEKYNSQDNCAYSLVDWFKLDHKSYKRNIKNGDDSFKSFKMNFYRLKDRYNYSDAIQQQLQLTISCECFSNRTCKNYHYKYAYNGLPFISISNNLEKWITDNVSTTDIVNKWIKNDEIHNMKYYLMHECTESLLYILYMSNYISYSTLQHTFISKVYSNSNFTILRCWAGRFFPSTISMFWYKNNTITNNLEEIDVRPLGDGTFQKWISVNASTLDIYLYECKIKHVNISNELILKWNTAFTNTAQYVFTICITILVTVIFL
ncbi:MHC class I-like protein [Eptesipox virus]|nr:MHC class I-like protein [Eptesipox virus]